MTTLNIYLTFNGNCLQAFNFYQSIFGGDFAAISYFKDMPDDLDFKISDADKDKVMHVSLSIGGASVLMGSDTCGDMTNDFNQGNNFSVSINTDSQADADHLFNELSTGGQITMPMNKTFWGSYFGMLSDQFGVQWMVSFDDSTNLS